MKAQLALVGAALAVAGFGADRTYAASAEHYLGWLDAEVPSLLREYNVPGVAIVVVENTSDTTIRTFGNTAGKAGSPVTATTVFNVGSISKTFTAWGVMRTVDTAGIDIDAPVERYLTRWHFPQSAFDSDGVTLRRLLSHTAGVSVQGYPGWPAPSQRSSLEASLAGNNNGAGPVQLVAAPGSRYSYSGGGYSVAQLAIEEQVRQPFERYYDATIFPAMGLTDSHFTVTPELIARSAQPHDSSGQPIPMRTFAEVAAAGLSTTIEDMGRLVVLTLRGGVLPDGKPFLSPQVFAALIEPQVAAMPADPQADVPRLLGMKPSPDGSDHNYGLGYHIYKVSPGRRVVGHTGANIGWRAALFASVETGEGIAIVTNADGGGAVRNAILCHWARHVAGSALPAKPDGGGKISDSACRQESP